MKMMIFSLDILRRKIVNPRKMQYSCAGYFNDSMPIVCMEITSGAW